MKPTGLLATSLLIGACSIASSDLPVPVAAAPPSGNVVCSSSEGASDAMESVAPVEVEEEPTALPNEALEHVTIAKTRTSMPKQREWQDGKPVDLARYDARCAGRLVREWLRIRCFIPRLANASLLGGTREGLNIRLVDDHDGRPPDEADIVFPLRLGDRRVVQITSLSEGGDWEGEWGGTENISAMISESWVDEDQGPIVVVGP